MDLLERRVRLWRFVVALSVGIATGIGMVWAFAQVLDHDSSNAPAWFAVFTFVMTLALVTAGTNALLTTWAKRRWHLPIPTARVVRR